MYYDLSLQDSLEGDFSTAENTPAKFPENESRRASLNAAIGSCHVKIAGAFIRAEVLLPH